jgi:lysophospholipase L1-like esterase
VFVNLKLEAYSDPLVTGSFSWDPSLARNLGLATANLEIYPAGSITALHTVNLLLTSGPFAAGKVELDPGYYRVVLKTTGSGSSASLGGITELIHVYSGLETRFPFSPEDFLTSKPLGGSVSVSGSGVLAGYTYIKLTAIDPKSSAELGSVGRDNNNTAWQINIPMHYESVKLKVEFFVNPADVAPLYTDTQLITGIGDGGQKGKTDVHLAYSGTSRTISSSVTNAGNNGNKITVTNGSSATAITTAISGQTVWVNVDRAANFGLKELGYTISNNGNDLTWSLIAENEDSAKEDYDKASYIFTVPVSVTGNIAVNAVFESRTQPAKIVCYGDSVTFGVGEGNWYGKDDDETLTYPYVLGTKLTSAVTVVNSGVNQNRLESAMTYLYDEVISLNPTVVIVNLGINDFTMEYEDKLAGFTFYEFQRRYNELLRNLANGKRIIYVAKFMNDTMFTSFLKAMNVADDRIEELLTKYTDMYNNLKTSYGVKIIDDVWINIKWYASYGSDQVVPWNYFMHGIHPDVAGYAVMAENYAAVLKADPDIPANWK